MSKLSLEDRLHNLELVVAGYHALIRDSQPPEYIEVTEKLMEDFFNTTELSIADMEFRSDESR
jgi:hypothetical protein